MRNSSIGIVVAIVVAATLATSVVMALAMGNMGNMMDGHMGRGGSRAPQTPVVVDAAEAAVEIRDFDYSPRDITVNTGTEVTWTNRDDAPHGATDRDNRWDTGMLKKDQSGSVTFNEAGAYEYYCVFHPDMVATITVR